MTCRTINTTVRTEKRILLSNVRELPKILMRISSNKRIFAGLLGATPMIPLYLAADDDIQQYRTDCVVNWARLAS